MLRWTEDTTIKFVYEYLRHECLWNFNNKNYRNKLAKQRAFCDIANTMGIKNFDAKSVYVKIKSLRSTYSQEMKKIRDSKKVGAVGDEIYKPHLKWFKLMNNALKVANKNVKRTKVDETEDIDDNSTELYNEVEKPTQQAVKLQKPMRKRKVPIDDSVDGINLLHQVDAVNVAPNSSNNEKNEFDIFGQSVASQLKAMPLILALQAQQHIQNYLCEARISHLRNSRRTQTSIQSTFYEVPSTSSTYYEDYRTPSPSWTHTTDNQIDVNCNTASPSSDTTDAQCQNSSTPYVKSEFGTISTMVSIQPSRNENNGKRSNLGNHILN